MRAYNGAINFSNRERASSPKRSLYDCCTSHCTTTLFFYFWAEVNMLKKISQVKSFCVHSLWIANGYVGKKQYNNLVVKAR